VRVEGVMAARGLEWVEGTLVRDVIIIIIIIIIK
jgi:hypothetical protein